MLIIGDSSYKNPEEYAASPYHQHTVSLSKCIKVLQNASTLGQAETEATLSIKEIVKLILDKKPENFSIGDQLYLKDVFVRVQRAKLFSEDKSIQTKVALFNAKLNELVASVYKSTSEKGSENISPKSNDSFHSAKESFSN